MVEKVVMQDALILFFIKQEEEYSVWEISKYEWIEYWKKAGRIADLSIENANIFANDPDNDTLGCSEGMFGSIEQAMECFNIKEV